MKLIPDVRRVLKRAWSLRLIELAALADIILNALPYTADRLPWWLTLVLLAGACRTCCNRQAAGANHSAGRNGRRQRAGHYGRDTAQYWRGDKTFSGFQRDR